MSRAVPSSRSALGGARVRARPVAVTGSTGRIGGGVARRLARAGISQRLVVRDPSRAPALEGAAVVQGAYRDGDAIRAALDGIDTVFMVSASEAADRLEEHHTFVDAAAAVGVRRLVYLSFLAAAPDATFTLARDHWATEQRIREHGLAFTFLRDSLYLDVLPIIVGEDGVIRGPAGDGRVSAVAQDDVIDAVTAVLRRADQHEGATYDLTGAEALSFEEIAVRLSRHLGRAITYRPETVDEAYASRAAYGAPGWQLDAWVSTYTAIAAGELARVSPDLERLSGRPPRRLEDLPGSAPD